MIRVDLAWVAAAVDGRLVGANIEIESVSTDTRQLDSGCLFLALQGPNFDAHEFVPAAVAKGAAAVLVERELPLAPELPQIVVVNTRHALGQLGAAVQRDVQPKTIAITGSSGKTTVKEMMAAILSQRGEVLATAGNFNNDIGVPLTQLRLTKAHTYAVLELGANHPGEIAYTSALVQPEVAIINNVAPAHVEGFGSVHGVAKAKSEIFRGLVSGGLALTPRDSEFHGCWQRVLAELDHQVFGEAADADIRVSEIHLDASGCPHCTISLKDTHGRTLSFAVHVPIPGRHNAINAAVAAAATMRLGATETDVQQGLAKLTAVPGRLQSYALTDQIRLLDDSYNANVGSTKAALALLASFSGQRIMIMGDMGELGAQAREYHAEVGEYAAQLGIDQFFSLGVLSQHASDAMGQGGQHFASLESLLQALTAQMSNTEQPLTMLVKGSRSAHMERVVNALRAQVSASNGANWRADTKGQQKESRLC